MTGAWQIVGLCLRASSLFRVLDAEHVRYVPLMLSIILDLSPFRRSSPYDFRGQLILNGSRTRLKSILVATGLLRTLRSSEFPCLQQKLLWPPFLLLNLVQRP
ncbi:uncharacterized protein EDB91DRAFT_741409 [Suillus paluster]|uniref:uncharacterized protein n=1 Tax=Suillus paluster TaxID=48578 RepID=UPI001B86B160|nr:uncharacterized protein EDB91DRAFT_741409 [Suillus paluster]KAG1730809.1 hypothetical protein EDB91DRAFT_741409 [Suillus paluster]